MPRPRYVQRLYGSLLQVSCSEDGTTRLDMVLIASCTWSMHFVGSTKTFRIKVLINPVLALGTGVPFWFNVPLTILSAAVALSASFVPLGSDLFMELLKRRRFRHISLGSPEHGSSFDDESSVDSFSRSSFSHSGESSQMSSTRAELEALLGDSDDPTDVLGDSWAKDYLVTKLLWTFWYSCTWIGVAKGMVLGSVFVTMHYTGSTNPTMSRMLMEVAAMRFDGFIVWNYWLVLLSFLISWLTSQVRISHLGSNSLDCSDFQFTPDLMLVLISVPSRINAPRQVYFSAIVLIYWLKSLIEGRVWGMLAALDRHVGRNVLHLFPTATRRP
jgi:NO-binding membrane sensor protein with MHYT domain